MMKKLFSISILSLVLILLSCASKKDDAASENQKPNYLVLYYSQAGGATKTVAEQIQLELLADIESIQVETPYDGDFNQTIERCQKEKQNNEVPAIKPLTSDISKYDVIFIGYPIWFGTYATPISSLVSQYDFAGKKIVTFATFGSGGLDASTADMKKVLSSAEVVEGYGVRNARIDAVQKEVDYFLKSNGYKDGEVKALPEFSAQVAVTDKDKEIFDAACGDYQFPLGTPSTVGSRNIEGGVEYKYIVENKDQAGNVSTSTIYVIVEGDAKPVFTKVVRN